MNYIFSKTAASLTSTDAVVTASMPWQVKEKSSTVESLPLPSCCIIYSDRYAVGHLVECKQHISYELHLL
jgi:hypothetical protein